MQNLKQEKRKMKQTSEKSTSSGARSDGVHGARSTTSGTHVTAMGYGKMFLLKFSQQSRRAEVRQNMLKTTPQNFTSYYRKQLG